MTQIWCHCNCGVGQQLQLQFDLWPGTSICYGYGSKKQKINKNKKHQSCSHPRFWGSGIQGQLSGDGSSLFHMVSTGSWMDRTIQDGHMHMSEPLVQAIGWEPRFISARYLFLTKMVSQSIRNPDQAISHTAAGF